ncbi:MAG: insulinase family protein [Marinosulfonomonas sp.]|nr:insulinase family protein [Marinosulfonomonas sp.]
MNRFFAVVFLIVASTAPLHAAVEVQEVTSPGGIKAWLVEEHSIPFVALELRFRGGSALDAPGKRGAINLMTGLLEEGAAGLNAQEFSQAREELATSFSYRVHDDTLSISARFLTENRAAAVDLLRTSIMSPTFTQTAIDRVRGQVLSGIRGDLTDPSSIAGKNFDAMVWGDHPYGSDRSGTEASVNGLTRDDILDAYDRVFGLDRIYVSAVGDISADELGALMDVLLGDLPESGAPSVARAAYKLTGGVTVIPFDTPQSVALFGHKGITRDDPDFMPAYILNEVFGGGGFESRLMQEVREKRGLTYGIGTYLAPMEYGELILGQVRSDNSRMAESIDVIRAEWAKIASTGLTAKELEDAKTFLTGAYALRFDGNAPIARIMVGMQMTGLPVDYLRTRNDQVNAVTLEQINRVAARIYQPEELHFVVVGQPDGLESSN